MVWNAGGMAYNVLFDISIVFLSLKRFLILPCPFPDSWHYESCWIWRLNVKLEVSIPFKRFSIHWAVIWIWSWTWIDLAVWCLIGRMWSLIFCSWKIVNWNVVCKSGKKVQLSQLASITHLIRDCDKRICTLDYVYIICKRFVN